MLLLLRLARALGFKGIYRLGGLLGDLAWFCLPARRRYTLNAVRERLGKGPAEARRIARESFRHSLRAFLELALARDFTPEGNPLLAPLPALFRDIQREERAVVAFTGHLGGWELLAGILEGLRPLRQQVLVVRDQKNRAANALIHSLRGGPLVKVVGHRNASAEVLSVLRAGGTTAFLVDHNTRRREAVFLPFLGREAAVNLGPAMLALRAKAMLYAVFLIRKPGPTYEIFAAGPLDSATLEGSVAEKTRRIAEFYTRTTEDFVRRYPEQWFWMHRRWKTGRPDAEPA